MSGRFPLFLLTFLFKSLNNYKHMFLWQQEKKTALFDEKLVFNFIDCEALSAAQRPVWHGAVHAY